MFYSHVTVDDELKLQFNIEQVVSAGENFQNISTPNQYGRVYDDGTLFIITKADKHCRTFTYSTDKNIDSAELSAQIDTKKIHLYGGAEHKNIEWPVNKVEYNYTPFVTSRTNYQAILEPYWLTSNGYCIYVDNTVPLFVSTDPDLGTLWLIAKRKAPYQKNSAKLALNFAVCQFDDPRQAQEYAIQHFLGKPTGIPDTDRVRFPIWSTWVKFKTNIDERQALEYAQEISEHGYGGQVEIDDSWETCYGSLTPDKEKFPNLTKLVQNIQDLDFKVTIWVHPFVNKGCSPVYKEARKKGYLVRDNKGKTAMSWWRGPEGRGNYIDFTNPEAADWYVERLIELKETYGVDSFKFDGGESSFSPPVAQFYKMEEDHPETIVKAYVKTIDRMGTNVHTRTARGTQQYPIFVTMMDRESNWSKDLGLATMIPQLLQMNILGYSFVLPDMIGGNFYGSEDWDTELFVRWLQVNVFMPSMQFSLLPWDFGEEVRFSSQVNIMKSYQLKSYRNRVKLCDFQKTSQDYGKCVTKLHTKVVPQVTSLAL